MPGLGRPKNRVPTSELRLKATPKLKRYLEDIVLEEGYGRSAPDAAVNLIWRAIEDLIAKGVLDRRAGPYEPE